MEKTRDVLAPYKPYIVGGTAFIGMVSMIVTIRRQTRFGLNAGFERVLNMPGMKANPKAAAYLLATKALLIATGLVGSTAIERTHPK